MSVQEFSNYNKDVVSWTSLILGYAKHGYGDETCKSFAEMQHRGIQPNAFNFVGILKACVSNTRAIQKGCETHVEIERKGQLDENITLGYAKQEQDCIERLVTVVRHEYTSFIVIFVVNDFVRKRV